MRICSITVGYGREQGLPGIEHPDTVFFFEWTRSTNGTQWYLAAGALHFKSVARLQMQVFPKRLGNNGPAALSMVRWTFIMVRSFGLNQWSIPLH